MKIAINDCWGGFSVSELVSEALQIPSRKHGFLDNESLGIESNNPYAYRADPRLINAIESIGENAASGEFARIRILTIPDDVLWYIEEHDGMETVHEKHRIWSP